MSDPFPPLPSQPPTVTDNGHYCANCRHMVMVAAWGGTDFGRPACDQSGFTITDERSLGGVMRAAGGACGPNAILWAAR